MALTKFWHYKSFKYYLTIFQSIQVHIIIRRFDYHLSSHIKLVTHSAYLYFELAWRFYYSYKQYIQCTSTQFKMKSILVLTLMVPLYLSYMNLASSQPMIRSGSIGLQMAACNNKQYECSQNVFVYQTTITLAIYPQNTIYLAANSLKIQAPTHFSTASPYYYFTHNYTLGSSYFSLIASFSTGIGFSLITVAYIAVQKSYPLFFRAFQYTLNVSQPTGIIDSLTILNQTATKTNSTIKFMYAVSGLTFNPNISSQLSDFNMNATFNASTLSIAYSFDAASLGFISAVRINVALFGTFAVFNSEIYIFDIGNLVIESSDNVQLDYFTGISPIVTGIASVRINKTLQFGFDFKSSLTNPAQNNSLLSQNVTGSTAIPSFATNLNIWGYGKFGCRSFVAQISGISSNGCNVAQNFSNSVLTWVGNCTVSASQQICSMKSCGNGVQQQGQECDMGKQNGLQNTGCSNTCKIIVGFYCQLLDSKMSRCLTTCGDGVVAGVQNCDLGTNNGYDLYGCTIDCLVYPGFNCTVTNDSKSLCEPICGDSITIGQEDCDLGIDNGNISTGCTTQCKAATGFYCVVTTNKVSQCKSICGDSIKASSQDCDMGKLNGKPQQGCSYNCTILSGFSCEILSNLSSSCRSVCGDGLVVGFEKCDLKQQNSQPGSGCSKNCTILVGYTCQKPNVSCKTTCGDGLAAGNEQCDLNGKNNGNPLYGCNIDCTAMLGFNCQTDSHFISSCKTNCSDKIVAGSQKCDLGENNGDSNSGCSLKCSVRTGFACNISQKTLTSDCFSICGDGIVAGRQECDLGANNTQQYSGCNETCFIMEGYYCNVTENQSQICVTRCGDGIVARYEGCDNGDKIYVNGSGCDSECKVVDGYSCPIVGLTSNCTSNCGDGILAADQQCDQGTQNGKQVNPCSQTCRIQPGYYCNNTHPLACTTHCGDGFIAGSEECDNGNQNRTNNTCLPNCTYNINNSICIKIDPDQNCSQLFVTSPLNLTGYTKTLASNSVQITLTSQQPLSSTSGRLLISIDTNKQYQLPKQIILNFPYKSATVRFPDVYTMIITAIYAASLNGEENLSVTVARFQTKLPDVTDNNLALKLYKPSDYNVAVTFLSLVPISAYFVFGLSLLMLVFTSKILGLQVIFLFQFAHGCLIMLRKLQVGIYPFSSFWIFSGYFYPLEDNSRVDPRVGTLGYRANFLSNFNVNLVVYLLPLTIASLMFAYKKIRKARSHRLERAIKSLGEDWQLTAMMFALQPLVFAFVINLTYSPTKVIGVVIGLALMAVLTFYLFLYYEKDGDLAPQRQRFKEFKKCFRTGQQNFCIWIIAYKALLSLAMVTVSQSIVSQSMILVLICSWIAVLFIKRPYIGQLQLQSFINSFVMLILILFFLYSRSAADLPEINFATYIPIAVLILLGCTFIFDITYAIVFMYRARLIALQLEKDRKDLKNIEYTMQPTIDVFKETNEKTLQVLYTSQSGDGNPTQIITVILDRQQDKDGEPSTQFKKDAIMPQFQISSIHKNSELSENYVSEFQDKVQFKLQNSPSPRRAYLHNDYIQSRRRGLSPIEEEPPVLSIRQQ